MLTLCILPVYGLRTFGMSLASVSRTQFKQFKHDEDGDNVESRFQGLQSEYSVVRTPYLSHNSQSLYPKNS